MSALSAPLTASGGEAQDRAAHVGVERFHEMWDQTIKEYEERAGECLEAMRRHELDAKELREKHASAAMAPRVTPKLLDLRRIEGCAKRGDYLEAHKVKLQADALEAEERARRWEGATSTCTSSRRRCCSDRTRR